jgi:hypothetical protein
MHLKDYLPIDINHEYINKIHIVHIIVFIY